MANEAQDTQGNTEEQVAGEASTQTQNSEAATEEVQTEGTVQPEGQSTKETTTADRGLLGEAEDSKESIPESYEDFSFPEGTEVSKEDMDVLKTMAKEHGLTQNEAQKSVVLSRTVVQQIAQEEQKVYDSWKAENAKEWEGQQDHANKTLLANKAVTKLGLSEYFGERGYVHDAKLLGAFAELGKYMSEATHVAGVETAPQGAGQLYDKSPDLYK